MCGIVGHISTSTQSGITWKAEKALNNLLFANTVRGDDATGMFMVEDDGTTSVMKEALPAPWVMGGKEHTEIMRKAFQRGRFVVGHNRKATVGKCDDDTAHPFIINDEFVLVHNGTLTGYKHLFPEGFSDSHTIAHVLHKTDFTDDAKLNDAFWKFNGAYALVFYDRRNETLYLTRNSQRPLHVAFVDHNGWFFASEKEMLMWVLERNDLKVKESFELEVNKLYSITLDENKFTTKDIKPFFQVPTHSTPTQMDKEWVGEKIKQLIPTTKGSTTNVSYTYKDLKKFRRNFLNRALYVVIEDSYEMEPGQTVAYGKCPVINIPHHIEIPLLPADAEELQLLKYPVVKVVVNAIKATEDGRTLLIDSTLREIYHDVQSKVTH